MKVPQAETQNAVQNVEAGLRILVIQDSKRHSLRNTRAIQAGLKDSGYQIVELMRADLHISEKIQSLQPDIIIVESETGTRDMVEDVCVATQNQPRPIVLFTDNEDRQIMNSAIKAGVTAYIVDGLKADRVKAILDVACMRFQFENEMRIELTRAQDQLSDRKVIEKAKGILMDQFKMSESEAYNRLRSMAMDQGIKLTEVSKKVIDFTKALKG